MYIVQYFTNHNIIIIDWIIFVSVYGDVIIKRIFEIFSYYIPLNYVQGTGKKIIQNFEGYQKNK